MKIVTYNVNGLRARIVPYKSLHGFLNALDADILCFQETKLSRQELTADIAMAEGYEAFFSCTRTSNKGRIGYSGVATFCRTPVTTSCTSGILPIAADEGFTGLLHCSKGGEIEGGDSRVGCYGDVLNMTMSRDELLCLDSEGRCVVTDHGSFVLFNIYGPCVQCGDTKRMEFKLNFYQALQCRWESLLEAGKRLIVVGDLNIAPFPNDSCDPGPKFNSNPCRRWLQSLLSTQNGPFTDTFRAIHSVRKDAYTCWSQASGAEEFNWGTRIDLILAAGSCKHPGNNVLGPGTSRGCHGFAKCEVEDCDIMVKFKRLKEDSIPRWAGGRNLKLEGSDHAPVFVTLKEQPPVRSHEIPSLAVRFLPQLRGRQQSIDSLLQKRNLTSNGPDVELSCATMMHVGSKEGLLYKKEVLYKKEDEVAPHVDKVVTICGKAERIDVETSSANGSDNVGLSHRSCCRKFTPALKVQMSQKLKRKEVQKASQMSLRTFFARSSCSSPVSANLNADSGTPLPASQEFSTQEPKTREITSANMSSSSHMQEITRVHHGDIKGAVAYSAAGMQERPAHVDKEEGFTTSIEYGSHANVHKWEDNKLIKSYCFGESGKTRSDVKQKSAQTEWKRIQDLMARRIPVCSGHGEPCVARIVKKGGPNLGRGFYVCARAQGPTSNPEARCDHFEWASEKSKR